MFTVDQYMKTDWLKRVTQKNHSILRYLDSYLEYDSFKRVTWKNDSLHLETDSQKNDSKESLNNLIMIFWLIFRNWFIQMSDSKED